METGIKQVEEAEKEKEGEVGIWLRRTGKGFPKIYVCTSQLKFWGGKGKEIFSLFCFSMLFAFFSGTVLQIC